MKCENCGKNEVTFVYQSNINGKVEERHLCGHLRYDTASTASSGWRHWMLKEILSFGFAYAFSTK